MHDEHRQVATALAGRISQEKRVAGIVYLGGLTRGFADEHSDVDIVVLLTRDDARLKRRLEVLGASVGEKSGLDVDLEIHSLRSFERLEKTDGRRWEYRSAEIVLDRAGLVKRAISLLLAVPDSFWVDRIVEDWTYLQWYACQEADIPSIAESWVDRGDLASAHACVNYAVEILMELVYALNREFLPVPKWRFHCVHELEWRPRGLEHVLEDVMCVRAISETELSRRLSAIRAIRAQLRRKVLETTRMSPHELARHFVKRAVYEED